MKKETKEKTKVKGCWWRAVLGILIAYLVFAVTCALMFAAWEYDMGGLITESVVTWIIFTLLSIIVLLYCYGWLGHWLADMERERRSKFVRIIGKVLGGIGYLLFPYPLMVYGPNKKSIFMLVFALPLVVFGIVAIILGAIGTQILQTPSNWSGDWSGYYIIVGVLALLNALFAFLTKKCPKCGCLMSKISYETLSFDSEIYTRQYSREIGSVSYGNGESATVYGLYDAEHEGYVKTSAKTFTCKNCGTIKQKRARTHHYMSHDDLHNFH